jgi:hypothetical protein
VMEAQHPLTVAESTVIVGARFWVSNGSGGLIFSDTSNNVIAQAWVNFAFSGATVQASQNGSHGALGGTSLGSASIVALTGAWYELEAKLIVGSGTAGSLIVKLNGATVLSLTGINTQGSAGSSVGYAGFSLTAPNGNVGFVDDLYIGDSTGSAPENTFLSAVAGPMGPRVAPLPPTSDGATMQWTPSTGSSGYACVNKTSFADTPYIEASTAGQVAQFGIGTLNASAILAVQTAFAGHMDDAGFVDVNSQIIVAGTITNGASRTFTGNDQKFIDLYTTDPTTGAAWAPSRFSTAGQVMIGVDRTA